MFQFTPIGCGECKDDRVIFFFDLCEHEFQLVCCSELCEEIKFHLFENEQCLQKNINEKINFSKINGTCM